MARPRDTPERKALRTARTMVKRLSTINPAISPKWHRRMTEYWQSEVDRLEAVVRAARSAH